MSKKNEQAIQDTVQDVSATTEQNRDAFPKKRFMSIKARYPIGSISNNVINISKGEVQIVPAGFEPPPDVFDVFEDFSEATASAKSAPIEMPGEKIGATTTETISKLRRVFYPAANEEPERQGFILRDKDIPEFLTQPIRIVLRDLDKLDDPETFEKVLGVEEKCDKRKPIIEALEKKLKL